MTTQELLAQCGQLGIRIWTEGPRLRVYAPNGALSPELRQQLGARRTEILGFLTQADRSLEKPAMPLLARVPRDGALPLSLAQQRLWLIDQLQPGTATYNLPMALRLRGTLAFPALAATLGEIVRRHEVLRTTLSAVDGEPRQVVAPPSPVSLPVLDLSGLPAPERAMERLLVDEARRPFDLAAGPLLRVQLLRLGAEDHVALLNMHHIVSDGWSFGVLIREIAALYPAFLAGGPSPLPELPIQYADFSAWQRRRLQGEALEAEVAYWRERLLGAPPVLELPADRPRSSPQSDRGALRIVRLAPDLSAEVAALARREGATLFMTLLAAFQTLLQRSSGQDDVSVGAPVAGRNRVETERLIGFFVNTLVLRTDLSGDPTFRELLARVRTLTLDAFRHQDLPFEKLVEEIRPERSLSHTPLFQAMLTLQNAPREELELPGLRLRPLAMEPGTAKLDLLLELAEDPSGIAGTLHYRTEMFEAATMERLVGHFQRLLEGAAGDPARRISELPWLSAGELHQVLWEWNDSRAELAGEPTLHRLFEAQAARTPHAVAIEMDQIDQMDQGAALTYAELESRASRLARHLRKLGVEPEALVGICAERSIEMVVGLLGILKAGGAYLPLDPDLPPERLAFVLGDAGVRALLVQSGLASRLPDHGVPTVLLDAPGNIEEAGLPPVPISPDALAYVIYTSGSTGKPKGAMNTHRAVVNRLLWMQSAFELSAADAVLQKTPFGFDVSVWEFFWPLAVGARLVMARPGGHQDPEYLAAASERARSTTLHFVPSMLSTFLEVRSLEGCRGVRRVIASGEALPADLAATFFTRLPGVELHNLYGPTEAAIDVTAWACAPEAGRRAVPIGRPIANLRIALLDRALAPVPIGVAGELYIGGAGLARGYVRRPDLTAERFLPDPHEGRPGARMYRTGDLARFRSDGAIEFLGRIDHQVKIRGFRIELGEIEAALGAHPDVREVVVLARLDAPGDPRLVAYVVPRASIGTTGLAEFLAATLPAYMVPSSFVLLPALPLNPNGKVDRRALPAPSAIDLPGREDYAAPRTPAEELLCAIWADVLDLPRVGIRDNFFALGGHSLFAARAVSRIDDTFGVELSLRSLFEAPTPAAMAGIVEQAQGRGAAHLPPITRSTRRGAPQPLSFAQLRFWARRHEIGASNVPVGARFSGLLDRTALERGLQEILRRHEVLRAAFEELDGEPVQVVRNELLILPAVDLTGLPTDRREGEIRRLGALLAGYPFDLARAPLVKAALLQLSSREHVLFLVLHHIITDGWSEGVLSEELTVLYQASLRGEPSPLPELPIQYADFAAWQREVLRGPVFDELVGFWLERLRDVPVLAIPTDRPRPAVRSTRGGVCRRRLDESLHRALLQLAGREGASLFMILLAAWKTVLFQWTGQPDVALTTNVANRGRSEIERLIGVFTNVLALRTDLSGDLTFRELLQRVRTTTLDAFAHQDLPFVEILSRLRPGQVPSYNETFPVGFVLQNFPVRQHALPDLTLEPIDLSSGAAPRDLILVAGAVGADLDLSLVYREDIFEEATIAALLARLEALIRTAVQTPELPLSRLSEGTAT
ncbi:MAG TPA: amino acid adenylation domain-containing protein [Thermoanaerobaculia bacterium]|nr:amino acid adenylation domain-containing protein [Thermoanaerobaculia bacterium]